MLTDIPALKGRQAGCKEAGQLLTRCHFVQTGVKCVRLQGSMSMDLRDRMIDQFTNDPKVKVFLMSLKAGGVALNLTAASHVMLMDPWSVIF